MRRVYILPNLFTSANLFCGLLAVFETLGVAGESNLVWACQLILVAGLFDVLDGVVARLTRTQSAFGLNFDSLADVVSFGVAPALIAYRTISPVFPLLAKATCGLYVICCAMRLARFNIQAMREEKRRFLGLPSPGAGCAVTCLLWVLYDPGVVGRLLPGDKLLPPVLVLLAYLMVSEFQYLGIKSLRLSNRQPLSILVSLIVILSMLFVLKQHLSLIALAGFGLYTISGPTLAFRRARARRAARTEPPPTPADPSQEPPARRRSPH